MAYTEPTNRSTGYGVTANDWNVFVENDKDFNGRISSLEDNQGTRGSNGNIYGEINSIKAINTNQNSRLTTLESEMDAVESKNTDQDTWMTTHLDGVSLADSSHATINNRLDSLEAGGGDAPAFFRGYVSAESLTINSANSGGGRNFQFGSTGCAFVEQGGFTVSGANVYFPGPGIYLVTAQMVAESTSFVTGSNAPEPTLGLYVIQNGTAGATQALADKEIKFPGVEKMVVDQVVGVATVGDNPGFMVLRVYSSPTTTARTVRGAAHDAPYGGTYMTITRLGGIA